MKTTTNITYSAIAVVAFACFTVLPLAQAVSPAPDGGYPGRNTAEGETALFSLTTGGFNTAVGYLSLRSDTIGGFNTAIGAGALLANTANENTATGVGALLSNSIGIRNTASGAFALFFNTTGNSNCAFGAFALESNTTANDNTATGDSALQNNTTGSANTATGDFALFHNTTGQTNTGAGVNALFNNTSGSNNTVLGYSAGHDLTTGDNNIDIGYNVLGVAGESNTIRIGNTDVTTTIIRGINGQTIPSGATVLVAANGQLGTMTSSARFKQDIKPMDKSSEALLALKPVSFRYTKEIDPPGISQFGLVAEDVEKVNPDLVVRDEKGKPYSVRYDQVNAMLLNEFLKEHKTVQELKSTVQKQEGIIAQQQKSFQSKLAEQERQIEALASGLQKVSSQLAEASPSRGGLELCKFATGRIRGGGPVPQVALNDR